MLLVPHSQSRCLHPTAAEAAIGASFIALQALTPGASLSACGNSTYSTTWMKSKDKPSTSKRSLFHTKRTNPFPCSAHPQEPVCLRLVTFRAVSPELWLTAHAGYSHSSPLSSTLPLFDLYTKLFAKPHVLEPSHT